MRKQLLAMASTVALGLAISASAPAGAIQLTPGLGNAADANVIHVQDRRGDGGGGRGGFSGGHGGGGGGGPAMGGRGGPSGGPGISAQGNFSAPRGNFSAPRGNFEARGQVNRGNFEARGQMNRGDFNRRDFNRADRGDIRARGQVQTREMQRRDFDRRDVNRQDFNRSDNRRADYSRWRGNRPHLVARGWDRHHRHRFFGAFLIGVPFGYYALTDNPCYDWTFGPQGWGYYWNYARCPV